MAQSSKGGLGRGLSSLLGGYYEERTPPAPTRTEHKPSNVQYESKAVPHSNGSERPTEHVTKNEPKPEEVRKAAEETKYVPRESVTKVQEKENVSVQSDDHIQIKSVSKRQIDEVPISAIIPNPDQPRTNFKKEELEELAASIEKDGLLQPILVRTIGESSYQIIAGERRWQACKLLNMKTVPVRVKEADTDKALELALVENVQRTDLNPIEEAYGYRRLMERKKMTQAEVAQAVSKGRSTVANALRLLELPEDAQQLLFEEKITAGHARAILSIPTKEGRQKLTDKLVREKLSVREAEAIARLLSAKKSGTTTKRPPLPASYTSVAKALKKALNTNVKVKSSNGKNKIEIEFKDEQDLERLFEELTASLPESQPEAV